MQVSLICNNFVVFKHFFLVLFVLYDSKKNIFNVWTEWMVIRYSQNKIISICSSLYLVV